MKHLWNFIKKYKIRFIFLGSLFLLFWLLFGLRYISGFSEFWSKSVGRVYQIAIGWITSIFPISIFELLIIAAVVLGVLWIIFFIRKTKKCGFKESAVKLITLAIVITSVGTLYVATAGMYYHRKPFKLSLRDTTQVKEEKYFDIAVWASTKLNNAANQLQFREDGSVINPYSRPQLCGIMEREFAKLDTDYLTDYTVKPKPLYIFGWLYSEMHISGVSFLPTGEANYNYQVPNVDLPFVMAHEIAHTKGVMNETDANYLAMYVCLNSEVPYLQYSALANALVSLEPMALTVNDDEKYKQFYDVISTNVWEDFAYSNRFWEEHDFFESISEWFNNLYLKVFGSETTEDYKDHTHEEIIIVDDDPVYTLPQLSKYQEIVVDLWLKENGL